LMRMVMDRNYPSYRMLAELTQHQWDFVILETLINSMGFIPNSDYLIRYSAERA
jgi:hypothetical protein